MGRSIAPGVSGEGLASVQRRTRTLAATDQTLYVSPATMLELRFWRRADESA